MTCHARRTPIDDYPAPCFPERPMPNLCTTCERWRVAACPPAETRGYVAIDASLLARSTETDDWCPMHTPRHFPNAQPQGMTA